VTDLGYSVVIDDPETGEPSVLCHGTSLKEAEEMVAALSNRYPDLRFGVGRAEGSQDHPLTRAAG